MQKRKSRLFMSSILTLTGSITLAFLLFSAATAESSWWQKGMDLLQGGSGTTTRQELTTEEIGNGLKDALLVGSANVVSQLSRPDGFNQLLRRSPRVPTRSFMIHKMGSALLQLAA